MCERVNERTRGKRALHDWYALLTAWYKLGKKSPQKSLLGQCDRSRRPSLSKNGPKYCCGPLGNFRRLSLEWPKVKINLIVIFEIIVHSSTVLLQIQNNQSPKMFFGLSRYHWLGYLKVAQMTQYCPMWSRCTLASIEVDGRMDGLKFGQVRAFKIVLRSCQENLF